MSTDPALELDHVTVRREGRRVLDDITLEVQAGTIHVVIGPNGAGKSTLLAALLGQIAFTGRIAQHFKRGAVIGYVPQSFVADRTLPITVGEFLALSRQRWPVCFGVRAATRATDRRAARPRRGCPGSVNRRLGELSGGELRRVLIANAIDPVPELLLCDEPATGLDPAAVDAARRPAVRAPRPPPHHGRDGVARSRAGPPGREPRDADRHHAPRYRPDREGARAGQRRGRPVSAANFRGAGREAPP